MRCKGGEKGDRVDKKVGWREWRGREKLVCGEEGFFYMGRLE